MWLGLANPVSLFVFASGIPTLDGSLSRVNTLAGFGFLPWSFCCWW